MASVKAEPYEFEFEARTTALVMIDFQRDFVDPGGFGEALGNDVALLRRAVPRPSRFSRSPARPVCSSFTRARAIVPTWPTARPRRRRAAG